MYHEVTKLRVTELLWVCNEPICPQGMMGDPGAKGLPQVLDVTHIGTDQYTLIHNTNTVSFRSSLCYNVS